MLELTKVGEFGKQENKIEVYLTTFCLGYDWQV